MGSGVSSSSTMRLRKAIVIRAYNLRKSDVTLDEQFRPYAKRDHLNKLTITLENVKKCLELDDGALWTSVEELFEHCMGVTVRKLLGKDNSYHRLLLCKRLLSLMRHCLSIFAAKQTHTFFSSCMFQTHTHTCSPLTNTHPSPPHPPPPPISLKHSPTHTLLLLLLFFFHSFFHLIYLLLLFLSSPPYPSFPSLLFLLSSSPPFPHFSSLPSLFLPSSQGLKEGMDYKEFKDFLEDGKIVSTNWFELD